MQHIEEKVGSGKAIPKSTLKSSTTSSSTPTSTKSRLIQLDILRGIAVLLVLGSHTNMLIPPDEAGVFAPFASFLERFGGSGVDLFFVLSGFLIGGLLFLEVKKYGELNAKRFIIRRGFKIWPMYYLFLAYVIFLPVIKSQSTLAEAVKPVLPNLFHVQNYIPTVYTHTWTLSLEEHFYLFLPLLLFFLQRRNKIHLIPAIAAVIAVTCFVLRCWTYYYYSNEPTSWTWKVVMPTHLRMDSLMFGVLLAYYYHLRPDAFRWLRDSKSARWWIFAAGLILASSAYFWAYKGPTSFLRATFGATFLYFGYGCIVMAFMHMTDKAGNPYRIFTSPIGRIVGFIGFYSYAIYLWHIDEALRRVKHFLYHSVFNSMSADMKWFVVVSIYIVFAVIIGVVCSRLVELPMLKIRDRLFPDKARG